jgi:U3 small nucleolar RNA-associated protein 15
MQRHLHSTCVLADSLHLFILVQNPVTHRHYNKVTDIEFSPLAPYDFAVTASTRVIVYDSQTMTQKKSLSRFTDVAYSGSYRPSDGKVLVAGSEDGKVRVFDLSSRVVLRTFTGHSAPVKACRFLSESRFLLSGSDDQTVRTWDMTTEQTLDCLRGHTDYVRSISEHTDFSPFCFFSGGYDHTVRYWDRRLSNQQGAANVFTFDHGAPVEDLLVLPNHGSGDLLATAGENNVQIWSVRMASSSRSFVSTQSASAASSYSAPPSTKARIYRASNHQKTILTLAYDLSTDRLISGGLDHMLKIYDMRPSLTASLVEENAPENAKFGAEFMQVTHSMKFSGPILAAAISPDSKVLAVGLADGTVSIRSREAVDSILPPRSLKESLNEEIVYSTPLPPPKTGPRPGTRAFFGRGANFEPGVAAAAAAEGDELALAAAAAGSDFKLHRVRKSHLAPYDAMLKGFRYHAALDAALATRRPNIIASVIDELTNRNGLVLALANRDAQQLMPVLEFVGKHISHPSYSGVLIEFLHLILDLYGSLVGTSPEIDEQLLLIHKEKLRKEIENQKELIKVQACMENIANRAMFAAERGEEQEEGEKEYDEEEENSDASEQDDEEMEQLSAADEDGQELEEERKAPEPAQSKKRKQAAPVPATAASTSESESDAAEIENESSSSSSSEDEPPARRAPAASKKPNGTSTKIKAPAASASSSSDSSDSEVQTRKKPNQKANGVPQAKAKRRKL